MEILTLQCPTNANDDESELRAWSQQRLSFSTLSDPVPSLSRSADSPSTRCIGSALADVSVALFGYVVRCHVYRASNTNARLHTETSVVADTQVTTLRMFSAVPSTCATGHSTVDRLQVVLTDLVQFLFSCWELLMRDSTRLPRQTSPPPSSTRTSRPTRWPGVFTSAPPAPTLLGDTGDCDVPPHDDQTEGEAWTSLQWRDGEEAQAALQGENGSEIIARSTSHEVYALVGRFMISLLRITGDLDGNVAGDGRFGCNGEGSVRCCAAIPVFCDLLQSASLLRRIVAVDPVHLHSLACHLLPRLLQLQRQQGQQKWGASRQRRSKDAIAATIGRLLAVLCDLCAMRDASGQLRDDGALRLHRLCVDSDGGREAGDFSITTFCPPGFGAGASLLSSLASLLQPSFSEQLRLRIQVLLFLRQLCSVSCTQHGFPTRRSGGARDDEAFHDEWRFEAAFSFESDASTAAPRSCSVDLVHLLAPLLLSGEGEEEVISLSCEMLLGIVTPPYTPRIPAFWFEPQAKHVSTTTELRDAAVDDADFSDAAEPVRVAELIEGYVLQALYGCTASTGPILLRLLECTTTMLANVRALMQDAAAPSSRTGESIARYTGQSQYGRQDDWRVVFHVAAIDVMLLVQVANGATLYNLLGRCGIGGHGIGPYTPVDWDEIAGSLFAVAEEHDQDLPLFTFLRCLDALVTGLQGRVQLLWSKRATQLVNELARRVARHTHDTALTDTAAALRLFESLLVPGRASPLQNDSSRMMLAPAAMRADSEGYFSLRHTLDAPSHVLLARVVASFVPVCADLLTPLCVRLLQDVMDRGELVSVCFSAFAGATSTATPTAVEESLALLRITTALLRTYRSRCTRQQVPNPLCHASMGTQSLSTKASLVLGRPPCTLSCCEREAKENGSGAAQCRREGLLDLLFGWLPDAPELLEARVNLIDAIAQGDAGAEETTLNPCVADPSLFAAAASLDEVAVRRSPLQGQFLLGLATLGCYPCIGSPELHVLLVHACRKLQDRLSGEGSGAFDEMTKWPPFRRADNAEGEAASTAARCYNETTDDVREVLNTLREVFALLVVHLCWYGSCVASSLESVLVPVSSDTGSPSAGPTSSLGYQEPYARAIMTWMETEEELQEGLCRFLFALHTRYGVDVLAFLKNFQSELTNGAASSLHQSPVPYSAFFATGILSLVLCNAATPSPFYTFVCQLRSAHWLLGCFDSSAVGEFPLHSSSSPSLSGWLARLLLNSLLHRVGAGLQGEQAIGEATPSYRCLQYVYEEVLCSVREQRPLQRTTRHADKYVVRSAASAGSVPCEHRIAGAAASQPTLAMIILRDFLAPLLLRFQGSTYDGIMSSTSVAEYSLMLLGLIAAVLWLPSSPNTGNSLDVVLVEFIMRNVRQLHLCTASELMHHGGAARRLLQPLLQSIYLLLMRAHRNDVVGRYGIDICLFCARVRFATIADNSVGPDVTLDSNAKGDGAAAGHEAGDGLGECILASIVYLLVQKIIWRWKGGAGGNGLAAALHAKAGATESTALTSLAAEADLAWYDWIPVYRLHRLIESCKGGPTSAIPDRAHRWRMLSALLAGVEHVIRLDKASFCSRSGSGEGAHPPFCSRDSMNAPGRASNNIRGPERAPLPPCSGSERDESQVLAILCEWCVQVLLAAEVDGGDDEGNNCDAGTFTQDTIVAVARLLYFLSNRFVELVAGSLEYDTVLLGCIGATALWCHPRFPLLAEGWVLASVVHVLPHAPRWYAHEEHVRNCVAHFFQRTSANGYPSANAAPSGVPVSFASKRSPFSTPASQNSLDERIYAADIEGEEMRSTMHNTFDSNGSHVETAAPQPELEFLLQTLVSVCCHYDEHRRREMWQRAPQSILPLGVPRLDTFATLPMRTAAHLDGVTRYCIPPTVRKAQPLMFMRGCEP